MLSAEAIRELGDDNTESVKNSSIYCLQYTLSLLFSVCSTSLAQLLVICISYSYIYAKLSIHVLTICEREQ